MKSKKAIIKNIDVLIKSCEEGLDGTWDCSVDEGKESFNDMITLLEEIRVFVNKNKTRMATYE